MGFCRRCGDIVTGSRCKCGGTSVEPSVQLHRATSRAKDRWSRTYVAQEELAPVTDSDSSVAASDSASPAATKPVPLPPPSTTTMTTPPRRFPRPISTGSFTQNPRVSAHINSTTSHRPPSPLKQQIRAPSPSSDPNILPTPGGSGILTKVYGSLLQRPETLATYSCSSCDARFQPDQTIYPAPGNPAGDSFVCKACFTQNGGSIGSCASCGRDVMRLKSEGTWVENGGRVWHSRCFKCSGCGVDLSHRPTVDLLGQPSCEGCFDTCLSRNSSPSNKGSPRLSSPRLTNRTPITPKTGNPGGMRSASKTQEQEEGSPVVDELSRRLGVSMSREGTPASKTGSPFVSGAGIHSPEASPAGSGRYAPQSRDNSPLAQRTKHLLSKSRLSSPQSLMTPALSGLRVPPTASSSSDTVSSISSRDSLSSFSPSGSSSVTSIAPDSPRNDVFEFGKAADSTPPARRAGDSIPAEPEERQRASAIPRKSAGYSTSPSTESRLPRALPPLPALSSSSSKPANPPPVPKSESSSGLPRPTSRHTKPRAPKPEESCLACGHPLFNIAGGGRIVTLPPPNGGDKGENYHEACFRCSACSLSFADQNGRAVFVREEGKPIHVECARPTMNQKRTPSMPPDTAAQTATPPKPARPASQPVFQQKPYTLPSLPAATRQPPRLTPPVARSASPDRTSPTQTQQPRFGSSNTCPGCSSVVYPMEKGVVSGPQGVRWHAACLVCGGKNWRMLQERNPNRGEAKVPGCGKKLDSQARGDRTGQVWCRECMDLLAPHSRPSPSPTRTPLSPAGTGTGAGAGIFGGRYAQIAPRAESGRMVNGILTQLTGGGEQRSTSPVRMNLGGLRSISPVRRPPVTTTVGGVARQFTGDGVPVTRPRPKSVVGHRTGEGRGMFLVRQMTGTTS
ncbi:hypothetical protein BOTBODRAFT_176078 [Botryobasidium botryosum FD-172 SS1]|uniref:LIM zinc-binding domain-containing protein n=1 Tax=Botryobasidium botryosum (strain FD-172 SS1) TaxID=930990 RepID=A0A067MN05_BOTB1|nr:hypothetical protein BOTBODRAFT_176078 [Botryobasidium botryosum FD-172 SS1]